MRAQLITLDLAGLALHGLYKFSCVTILYFLADAVFYHGDWRNVAYAAGAALVMHYIARGYDAAFAEFVTKQGEDEPRQHEFKFTVQPKRRPVSADNFASGASRNMTANFARLG